MEKFIKYYRTKEKKKSIQKEIRFSIQHRKIAVTVLFCGMVSFRLKQQIVFISRYFKINDKQKLILINFSDQIELLNCIFKAFLSSSGWFSHCFSFKVKLCFCFCTCFSILWFMLCNMEMEAKEKVHMKILNIKSRLSTMEDLPVEMKWWIRWIR